MKTRLGYLLTHLWFLFLSMYCFRNVIFRPLPDATLRESLVVLWALVIVSCAVGIALTIKQDRDWFNVFCNLMLPYGTYMCLAYSFYFEKRIRIIGLITLVFTLVCLLFIFCRRISNGVDHGRVIRRRIHSAIYVVRKNLSLGLLVFVLPIAFEMFFSATVFTANVDSVDSYGEEYNLANNIETIALFYDSEWQKLSLQERLDVAQVLVNCEANYLGMSIDLNVVAADLGEKVLGSYNDAAHRVSIDMDHLMGSTGEEVLRTLCHECFHAYQYQLCELYRDVDEKQRNLLIFEEVRYYSEEFADYTSGEEDILDYALQICEWDSRNYADESVEEYMERIEDFWFEKAKAEWYENGGEDLGF